MRKFNTALVVLSLAFLVTGCVGSRKDVSKYLEQAAKYQAEGEAEKAQIELRNAIAIDPRNPQANLALAKIEDASGDLQSAVPHYIRAAVPEARLIEPQLRVAQILLDSDRYTDAGGFINTALGAFPGNPDAIALRADLFERQGQLAPAKTEAEAALQKDRTNPRALAVLAMLALRDKDTDDAVSFVDRGLQEHPNDVRLLQVRATAMLTANQPDKAVDALKSIIHNAPHNVAIQTALAQIEAASGHVDQAVTSFRSAVEANPANQQMQLAFIQFLASQNKDGDIIQELHRLIGANPKTSTYDVVLAEYFRTKNELDKAGKALDDAADRLKEGPDFLAVQVARAKRQALQGNLTVAGDQINAVLAADPQNQQGLLFRATIAADSGRMTEAISDLLNVVRSNPVNGRAFQLLASSYLSLGRYKDAVDAMQRAVAVAPADLDAQIKLAAFLQKAGQVDATRNLITKLTLQFPTEKTVWIASGELAIERKDWPAATRSIARLRDLPNSNVAVSSLEAANMAGQGDDANAAKLYEAVIAAGEPIDPGIFGAYARASVAAGQTDKAANVLEQRVVLFKNEAAVQQVWTAIMTLRADAGQFDQAETAFRKAAQVGPDNVNLYGTFVRILASQNKMERAKQVIAQGLAAGANKTSMLLMSGSLAEASGDVASAMKAYKDALDSNARSVQAANNYGSLLADESPNDKAALTKVRDLLSGAEGQGDPSVLDTMAWLDYRLGRFDEAKRLLTDAKADQSSNPQIRFHLAATLLASGDRKAGLALLETVRGKTFPGSDEAQKLSES